MGAALFRTVPTAHSHPARFDLILTVRDSYLNVRQLRQRRSSLITQQLMAYEEVLQLMAYEEVV